MSNLKQEYFLEIKELQEEMDRVKRENEALTRKLQTYHEVSLHHSESEKRFEQLFNISSDAIYYFKISENNISAGKFIKINEVAHRRLGYTREEMLGMSPADIDIHAEEEIYIILEDVYTNRTYTFETTHVCKDGSLIPVEIMTDTFDEKGEKYFLTVCRNISDRKKAEKIIHNTKEQYKRLVESSPNGIAIIQDDKWVYANEAALKLFGVKSKENLLGVNIYDLLDPIIHNEYKMITTKDGVPATTNIYWKTIEGKELHTEVISMPFTFRERTATQLIIQDVTEQKHAEHIMIQAEKMNVIGEIAAGIAHEIRNPLTSLKGFVQLFRAGTVPNQTFIDIMETELERIDIISSEFLTLAKPGNINFTSLDLQTLIKDVLALLDTELYKQSILIDMRVTTENTSVRGEITQLKQVFINLIKNAIEVMINGGTITIILANRNGCVHISIRDEGAGMTDQQLSRLGEPFYTTKETGTGLGLMVSYTIISNHDGEVSVQSKLDEGTTFTVKLPSI